MIINNSIAFIIQSIFGKQSKTNFVGNKLTLEIKLNKYNLSFILQNILSKKTTFLSTSYNVSQIINILHEKRILLVQTFLGSLIKQTKEVIFANYKIQLNYK